MKKTVFRYDLSLLFVLIVVLLALLIFRVTSPETRRNNIGHIWLTTVPLISILFSVVSSVKISNEEITVTNWNGRRTLNWDEITGASLHFSELRLYNSARNSMLVVDLGVVGYETILETIMRRRYDLFRDNSDFIISNKVFVPPYWSGVVTLIFILISVYRGTTYWIPILIIYIIFQVFILLASISEIQVIGDIVHIKRSLRATSTYKANEVASISSEKRFTRLGRSYEVPQFHLKNGKTIEVEAGRMSAFVCEQLLIWHATYRV